MSFRSNLSLVLMTVYYFTISCWDGLSVAVAPSDSGLEDGFGRAEVDWPAHDAPMVRNCDALVSTLDQLEIDHLRDNQLTRQHFVSDLKVCNNQKKSCCTRDIEKKFEDAAVKTTTEALRSATAYLRQFLSDNHLNYQDAFLSMLRTAEENAEETLNNVYKIPKADWKGCLEDLFLDLSGYLRERDGDVTESVAEFYNYLFPVVFQFVLNDPSVLDLDLNYRECLMEVRQDLVPQPFGDAPTKLARGLTESLRAARTFLGALAVGAELMNRMTEHPPFDEQCSRALTRLEYCSLCEGGAPREARRSCRPLCTNVMRGCLSSVVDIERRWDAIVDGVEVLVRSMKGTMDVEEVLESFHTRLSESIMHSMETTHKYYDKILETCGRPRTTMSSPSNGDVAKFGKPSQRQHPPPSLPTQKSRESRPKLHSKLEMMLRSVVAAKGFLTKLPDAMCNSNRFSSDIGDGCWNGTAIGLYKRHVPSVTLAAQVADNPEMEVHLLPHPSFVSLDGKLQRMQKLLAAVVGDDEMTMQSDMGGTHIKYHDLEGSGGGGREGGARRYVDHRDDDDDDDDGLSDDEDIHVGRLGGGGGGGGSGEGSGYEDEDDEDDDDEDDEDDDFDDDEHQTNTKIRRPSEGKPYDDIDFIEKTTRRSVAYVTKPYQQTKNDFSGTRSCHVTTCRLLLVVHTSVLLFLTVSSS